MRNFGCKYDPSKDKRTKRFVIIILFINLNRTIYVGGDKSSVPVLGVLWATVEEDQVSKSTKPKPYVC